MSSAAVVIGALRVKCLCPTCLVVSVVFENKLRLEQVWDHENWFESLVVLASFGKCLYSLTELQEPLVL